MNTTVEKILSILAKLDELDEVGEDATGSDVSVSTKGYIAVRDSKSNDIFADFESPTKALKLVREHYNRRKKTTKFFVAGYESEINPDEIKIGCHRISFEKFDEIAVAVKRARG